MTLPTISFTLAFSSTIFRSNIGRKSDERFLGSSRCPLFKSGAEFRTIFCLQECAIDS